MGGCRRLCFWDLVHINKEEFMMRIIYLADRLTVPCPLTSQSSAFKKDGTSVRKVGIRLGSLAAILVSSFSAG